MNQQIKGLHLGTTLYSLTNQFHGREYSFEELIREVAKQNLGPGLEIVGFQSIRGFPVVTDNFAAKFKDLIAETGLTPTCLGINADIMLDPEHPMTDDESVSYQARQIEAAAKLGFPVVRYQYPAGAEVIRKLVPTAEKYGVKLGLEVHAPHHPNHPIILAYREMYEQEKSPMLGFIPDMGATARTVPPSFFETALHNGVPAQLIELAKEFWHDSNGEPYERQAKFKAKAESLNYSAVHISELLIIFGLFGKQKPETWKDIIPQSVHMHGKFFDFDSNGEDIAIDYKKLIPIFVQNGYNGYMSSEYEGHMWTDSNGFDKLKKHHKLLNSILANV